MNWEDRIRQSDAGKLMPERAEEIVREARKSAGNNLLDEIKQVLESESP